MQVENTLERSDLVIYILVFQEESTKVVEYVKQMNVEKRILFLISAKLFSLFFCYARSSNSPKLHTWQMAGTAKAQKPRAVCGIFGTKSCLLMTRFLTHCPLHSFSHPTRHARQQKPFPVVLEQNDGFLNFGVEKF